MATSSFFHNVIIDTDEKAARLASALDLCEQWSIEHKNDSQNRVKATIVEDKEIIMRLFRVNEE